MQIALPKIGIPRIIVSNIVAFSHGRMGEPGLSGLLAPAKPAPPGKFDQYQSVGKQ